MYKTSSLNIAFLDWLICKKKVGMATSLSRSSSGIIFLPGPQWARPSIIAIEHYLLAAFRPHVTFAT